MDRSIARGLKNLFFARFVDEIEHDDRAFAALRKKYRSFPSRKKWRLFVDDFQASINKTVVATYVGASSRSPLLAVSRLSTVDRIDKKVQNFSERGLKISSHIRVNGQQCEAASFLVVAEHAIERLLQRQYSGRELNSEGFGLINLIPQLRYLPVWIAYWCMLNVRWLIWSGARNEDYLATADVLLPTPNGLFLGRVIASLIEIRTFIHQEQFSANQVACWNQMRMFSERYQGTAVPFLDCEYLYVFPEIVKEIKSFQLEVAGVRHLVDLCVADHAETSIKGDSGEKKHKWVDGPYFS